MTAHPTARRDGPDAGAVSAMLAGSIEALALDLLGPPASRGGREWRWRGKGSLGVHVAGQKRGRFHDNEAGVHGDALDLVGHARGADPAEAFRWALGWLGEAGAQRPPPPARVPPPAARRAAAPDAEQEERIALALRIWGEAGPAFGTPAEAYLPGRGLELPADAPLRFLPACPRGAERLPAMLALMTDAATGEARGVHRTFLSPDGVGKAPPGPNGEASKMMLGAAGVVRLSPDDAVTHGMGLCEGIEAGLALLQRFGWAPVWAAGSAGAINRFPLLSGVESLTVFADNDATGLRDGRACAARWQEAGREARVVWPEEAGRDFADRAA